MKNPLEAMVQETPNLTNRQKELAARRSGYPVPLLRKVEEEIEKFT